MGCGVESLDSSTTLEMTWGAALWAALDFRPVSEYGACFRGNDGVGAFALRQAQGERLGLTLVGGAGILSFEVMLGGEPAVPCTRNPL